ncbi:MAG: TonB family protein [Paludibacter sp.]|nr:TonB family protein [Paludibacter sp.]
MSQSSFYSKSLIIFISIGILNTFFQNIGAATSNINAKEEINSFDINLSKDSVYEVAEKMPEFPGGEKALVDFISKSILYPEKALKKKEQGKVIVQFIVDKNGKVENSKILRGVSLSLDKEALRVISLIPDWIPGEQNGNKVSVYQFIPVQFKIPTAESMWTVNDKTVILIDGVKMPESFNTNILNPSKLLSVKILKPFPKEEKSRLLTLYGKRAANGVILITSNKDNMYYALADSTINIPTDSSSNCAESASIPEFPGGNSALFKFIADSIQYPFVAKQLKTQGEVIVRFLITEKGKVSNAQIMKSADYYLDKEALRVVNTLPDWNPGKKCSQKVNIYVTMPVKFKLELPSEEKTWEINDKTIVLLDGKRLPSSFDLKWLNYSNLTSYKVLQPSTSEITKKLVRKYGKDAKNGVVLIESAK